MRPTLDNSKYPVFEANQVLTNRHLNQVFQYLDEQERLTRANLIGIGIVCGLEISLAGAEVHIGKGCGITSEGYLIVEPADVKLAGYKPYTVPDEIDYPLFRRIANNGTIQQIDLWEMFTVDEPGITSFSAAPSFLDDKVVLLFLELKKEGLRNCSPTNCDDRGAEVYAILRRLLVSKNDPNITALIDGTTNGITPKPTVTDLEHDMLADLNLVDIRLPRYSVPAGTLTSSNTVLAAYISVFHNASLSKRVGTALTAAYHAFEPVVKDAYPANPFAGFGTRYGFLDSAPQNTTQARFLQYYYDLFDDLIKAYDEFRWKGAEMMCACCPPDGLFPRHLLLGLLRPDLWTANDPRVFRHYFMASAATSDCEQRSAELLQLFRRLVEMTERFTDEPPLFGGKGPENLQLQIRYTPSKLGDVPLSEKCIPYYYLQNGTPKLFQLWNTEKSRRKRAHQNLSYRSYEYGVTVPDFVSDPLRFDLEPNNFLRVEGHLGKNYLAVLDALVTLKNRNRLPIDIIALRTGAFDENIEVDINMTNCRFKDLETLYDATREQWMGFLCNDLTYLYGLKPLVQTTVTFDPKTTGTSSEAGTASKVAGDQPVADSANKAQSPPVPNIPPISTPGAVDVITIRPFLYKSKYAFINTYAPDFLVTTGTLGDRFEQEFTAGTLLKMNVSVKNEAEQLNNLFFNIFSAILNLVATLPQSLKDFKLADFSSRCGILLDLVKNLEASREATSVTGKLGTIDEVFLWEEVDDRLEDLLYNCRTEVYKSITDEFIRRVKEIKQKEYLSYFLLQHPGIQHKAGVPIGGTFILVYHESPAKTPAGPNQSFSEATQLQFDLTQNISQESLSADANYAAKTGQSPIFTPEFDAAFKRLQFNEAFALDEDFRVVQGALTGQSFDPKTNFDLFANKTANTIIAQYVNSLADGIVIADFFLPYLCCSDCGGVQYVLPSTLPTFTYTVLCTNSNNKAEVSILPQGGNPPYSIKVGSGGYSPISGNLVLDAGTHDLAIRDAAGTESAPQTIVIQPKITCTTPVYKCKDDLKTYTAEFIVSGGVPPFTASRGSIGSDNKYVSDPIASGTGDDITIIDSKGCSIVVPVKSACYAPLVFTATPKCTGTDKLALIDLTISGGATPYQLKIDTGNFAPITEHLKLGVGPHTLILKDATGIQKTQTFTILDPVVAVVVPNGYTCNRAGTEYMTRISVSGGKAPYRVNDVAINLSGGEFVYGPLPSGKAETLRITDALGCPFSLPIIFRCTRLPIGFDTTITPVSNKNQARLTLTPSEGAKPFSYQVDGGDFVELKGDILLDPGEHTIVIRDAEGLVSEQKKITVPPAVRAEPLVLQPLDQHCENGRYTIALRVSGGVPPYKLAGKGAGYLNNDVFTSVPMPSGAPLSVEIMDSAGTVAVQDFRVVCEPNCDKPCAGISKKSAYRLWVQPSSSPFEVYKPGEVEFTFTDENGKTQNIPGLSVGVLTDLLNRDFHGTMTALIKQINEKVAKAIGAGRLVLTYEPNEKDPLARLWVEYFQCEMFSMKFTCDYAQGGPVKEYEVRYMKTGNVNGATFSNLQVDSPPVHVPAFDSSMRDQCKDTPLEKLCNEPAVRVGIKPVRLEGDVLDLSLIGPATLQTLGITWIWEVERSTEALYLGPEVKVTVPGLSKGTKVKLTGITKQGCVISATQTVSALR